MTVLDKASFVQFWTGLDAVNDLVSKKLLTKEALCLKDLTQVTRRGCQDRLLRDTIEFAQKLLDEAAITPISYKFVVSSKLPNWFLTYLDSGVCPAHGTSKRLCEENSRIEEVLMEHLTAVWLVLYFLSAPMGHPWERVRRIADEQGGFPTGACMTKMIGDVYRHARHEFEESGSQQLRMPGTGKSQGVFVLSNHPSALIRDILYRPDGKLTPDGLHQLGRCYALFQLRLYAGSGYPIRYIATLRGFVNGWQSVEKNLGLPSLLHPDAGSYISEWLAQVFAGNSQSRQSAELLLPSGGVNSTSPCFLGPHSGVYIVESGMDASRFTGNRVNNRLLTTLRDRLIEVNPQSTIRLLFRQPGELHKELVDALRLLREFADSKDS